MVKSITLHLVLGFIVGVTCGLIEWRLDNGIGFALMIPGIIGVMFLGKWIEKKMGWRSDD